MNRPIHLVGSVPLEDAESVMATCCSVLGDRLARVPDGETGERTNWIHWQRTILGAHPAIHVVGEGKNAQTAFPKFAIRPGYEREIAFPDLGYAKAALESYEAFKALKSQGKVVGQRFQVSLPTPLAAIACYVDAGSQERLFTPYQQRLLEEAEEIFARIPHDDLAVQWDVAIEFAVLEGLFPVWLADPFSTIASQLARLAEAVPSTVEAGFHFCYGDSGNKHFKEPEDMGLLTALANEVTGQAGRAIDWIHMPVPIDRDDAAYFGPLGQLEHTNLGQLFLGLVHEQDGVKGAKRRMAAADAFIKDYGIATECGLGRRTPAIIPDLLGLHVAI